MTHAYDLDDHECPRYWEACEGGENNCYTGLICTICDSAALVEKMASLDWLTTSDFLTLATGIRQAAVEVEVEMGTTAEVVGSGTTACGGGLAEEIRVSIGYRFLTVDGHR